MTLEMSEEEKRSQAKSIYLGYTQPVGENLKYVAFASDRPIASWHGALPHGILGNQIVSLAGAKRPEKKNFILSPIICYP
jgi:hypothetical protein